MRERERERERERVFRLQSDTQKRQTDTEERALREIETEIEY
jgi:hypothetical protein